MKLIKRPTPRQAGNMVVAGIIIFFIGGLISFLINNVGAYLMLGGGVLMDCGFLAILFSCEDDEE